jgi:aspartyl-tRNA(Asn)/glutamyl-tRNA(Gln) amidotransferase subunit A
MKNDAKSQINTWPTIAKIAKSVQDGEVLAVDLVKKSIELIDKNEEFHALLTTTKNSTIIDAALAKAKEIDEKVKNGQKVGRLAGVPFIAKDNFLVKNGYTTAGSLPRLKHPTKPQP